MFCVSYSTSANTGVAPLFIIEFTVDAKVNAEVITSSPFFKFSNLRLKCKAAVQEFNARAYFAFLYFLIYFQNL